MSDAVPVLEARNLVKTFGDVGRNIEVLRGVGENGLVASICPKDALGEENDPSYGYNPALEYLAGNHQRALEAAWELVGAGDRQVFQALLDEGHHLV